METEQHATIKKFNKAIKQEIRVESETDENKNTSYPKSGTQQQFTAMQVYLK